MGRTCHGAKQCLISLTRETAFGCTVPPGFLQRPPRRGQQQQQRRRGEAARWRSRTASRPRHSRRDGTCGIRQTREAGTGFPRLRRASLPGGGHSPGAGNRAQPVWGAGPQGRSAKEPVTPLNGAEGPGSPTRPASSSQSSRRYRALRASTPQRSRGAGAAAVPSSLRREKSREPGGRGACAAAAPSGGATPAPRHCRPPRPEPRAPFRF